MVLAIDIGNSNTTIGLFGESGKILFIASIETNRNLTRDQCAIAVLDVLRLYGHEIKEVTGAIIASVVPPLTPAMASAVARLTGKPPMQVGPGVKTGLNIRTELHTQLGADIVCSAVAALAKYPTPIIVIDMGTGTTISLISRAGAYEGCAIFPGVHISLSALSEHAAQLPQISITAPPSCIGKNTIDSMRAGVVYGNAAVIEGIIARMEAETEPVSTVVATGGNAHFILRHCKRQIQYDADLLLEGLYLIYTKNEDKNCKK